MNEREFLKRLLATFKLEARELLDAMSSGLMRLEAVPHDSEAVESVFRDAHSLKGAARAVNLLEIARHCHRLEDVFSEWKRARLTPSPRLFDSLHRSIDALQHAVASINPDVGTCDYTPDDALREIDIALNSGPDTAPADTVEHAPDSSSPSRNERSAGTIGLPEPGSTDAPRASVGMYARADTVRIPTTRMDSILVQTEELLGVKLAAAQRASDLARLGTLVRQWTRETPEHPGPHSETGAALAHKLWEAARGADRDQRNFSTMLDGLLADLKQALMIPVGTLLEGLSKVVRDLSREQEKEIELTVQGEQIEVDRRVLEELRTPLIHILRNCIDHGIEPPARRLERGKPPRGLITIQTTQLENKYFELRIRDDGRGFDTEALRAAAVRSGILPPDLDQLPGREDHAMLAFHSGISTSPILTDVSGRGLGLAIVRNKIERLGGTITLSVPPGGGSELTLLVPISLATFRGVLLKCGEQSFLLPTHSVRRVFRLRPDMLISVEGKETLRAGEEILAVSRLNQILGLPECRRGVGAEREPCVLVVESTNCRLALIVDDVIAEQEVLVKGLGSQLARVRHVAGAAILGSGALVPILYLPDIVHSAIHGGTQIGSALPGNTNEKRATSILLAEDSITARTLLKTILETAGHQVFPAVDGAEAWSIIRTNTIDLVISDVEMPRMNGFELTSRIRATPTLSQVPIILVTALESREDRERGIEAGANAYIVKSSFDQSNLFEAMQRLL